MSLAAVARQPSRTRLHNSGHFKESGFRSRHPSFAPLWRKLREFCIGRSVCVHRSITRGVSSSSFTFGPQAVAGRVADQATNIFSKNRDGDTPESFKPLVDVSEGEWLQAEEDDSRSMLDAPPLRLDWRLRASSRIKKEEESREEERKRRYPRRKRLTGLTPDPDSPYHHSFEAYRSKFLYLLRREEEEESAALKHRLSTWGIPRLVREGYCLTDLSAYWLEANHFGNPVASFSLGPGVKIPDSKLENGTQVLLSRLDPLKEVPEMGCVIGRTESDLRVSFSNKLDLRGIWRLDLGLPNLMYERMRSAISYLAHDLKDIEEASDDSKQYILQGTELRDVLLRSFQPLRPIPDKDTEEGPDLPEPVTSQEVAPTCNSDLPWEEMGAFKYDQRIVSWVKRYMKSDPIVLDSDPPLQLNDSQRRAVAAMIGRRISLIQGPPGTGKTKTIIETVKLLKAHFEVPHPILVGTYTNVAVDNLVEGLAKAGVKPLRVGSPGNIRPALIPHSLSYKLQCHPLHPTLEKAMNDLDSLNADISKLGVRYKKTVQKLKEQKEPSKNSRTRAQNMLIALEMMKQRVKGLERKIYAVRQEMLWAVLCDADVVCTTCLTAACSALNIIDFPVVFLDEASMSTEPASLIPIMKGSQHLALIGDHKQLPPVIVSKEAKEGGLNLSLFERLTEEGNVHSVMLNMQYRMHPDISRFPASEFYNHALQDGTVDGVGNALPGLEPPMSTHLNPHNEINRPSVIFLDHGGNESMKGRSRVNVTEAHLVASVVEDLLLVNKDIQGRDIGIIAPYAAQISLLLRFFNTDPQYQERFKSVLGVQRAMQLQHVEIKTVDGFEGREKDVIIFSTVRNNEDGHIGFLADKKRLNVGLTRAKRGLFVLGSIATLRARKGPYDDPSGGFVNVSEGYIQPASDDSEKQALSKKRKRGHESWERYAQFMLERKWVIFLQGSKLEQVLYGHWNSLKDRMEAEVLAEIQHGGGYPEYQPKTLRG